MPSRRAVPAAVLVLLAGAAGPASAALPERGKAYAQHEHAGKGDDWHVEVEVSPRTRLQARAVVVHLEECDRTAFAQRVPITRDGALRVTAGTFGRREGTWTLDARFTSEHELRGTFRVTTAGCDSGERAFEAHADGHDHHAAPGGTGHSHHGSGPAPGAYPDMAKGTPRARAQMRGLWKRTLAAARTRFPSYRAARRLGYRRDVRRIRRPLIFHLRHPGLAADGRVLDATRPESLVYWWPRRGAPVLVGFMYRAPLGRPPSLGAPLVPWHSHTKGRSKGDNQMAHVWLAGSLRSAFANCLPIPSLERRLERFRYSKPRVGAGYESRPCAEDLRSGRIRR